VLPPEAAAVGVEAAVFDVPPVIDGVIDDPAWERATPVTAFTQVHPDTGTPPSMRTEVYFGTDGRTLFIAVRAFDPAPRRIAARQLQRDADLSTDDQFTLVFDPTRSRRNGYLFRVNPNGVQQDGLIYDGAELRTDWDAIWEAQARIDATGWTAEIAIPLAALSGDVGGTVWGMNVERQVARLNEVVRWAAPLPDREVSSLADTGELTNVPVIRDIVGLRVQPSISMRTSRGASQERDSSLEPGLDLFYRLRPGVTAVVTLNTDFAETEVDDRVVNLTQFPLFLTEKRSFFLQDAGLFNFGGIDTAPLPYYSRRIGLSPDGEPLAIDLGVKLTAETGGFDLGVLGTRVDAPAGGDAADTGVLRLAGEAGENSRLGTIMTAGNPQGTSGSSLAGFDYHYRNTHVGGEKIVDAYAWAQQSRNPGLDPGAAVGASLSYPNLGFTGDIALERIEEDFLPALGFVQETGIRHGYGSFGYWWRTPGGASLTPAVDWEVREGLHDRRYSSVVNPEFYLESAAGDYIFPEIFHERERLIEPFEILPGLVIPVGDYAWDYWYLGAGTAATRALSTAAEAIVGEFYNGHRRYFSDAVTWRANSHLGLGLSYSFNDIDLPAGRFIVRVAELKTDVNLTTRHAGNLVLQWDNVSEQLGVNARLRWTIAPGRDLYLVVDRLMDAADGYAELAGSTTFKVVWNWLF
jgi:hypothetical protein